MGAIMKKNILRPIQFITKIFDAKEEELKIGLPTDVKHLAHIGFHGPDTNGPSWMDQYHSAPLEMQGSEHTASSANQWASQEINFEIKESSRDMPSQSPKPMRPRHSRRHQSEGTITVDKESPVKKKGHRFRKKKEGSKEDTVAAPDKPAVPKSKKKKSKDSEGGSGSSGPRRREAAVAPEEGGIRTGRAAKLRAEEISLS